MVRKNHNPVEPMTDVPVDTSDEALAVILNRLRETDDPTGIRELSAQLKRVIFHKQFENALDPEASACGGFGSLGHPIS